MTAIQSDANKLEMPAVTKIDAPENILASLASIPEAPQNEVEELQPEDKCQPELHSTSLCITGSCCAEFMCTELHCKLEDAEQRWASAQQKVLAELAIMQCGLEAVSRNSFSQGVKESEKIAPVCQEELSAEVSKLRAEFTSQFDHVAKACKLEFCFRTDHLEARMEELSRQVAEMTACPARLRLGEIEQQAQADAHLSPAALDTLSRMEAAEVKCKQLEQQVDSGASERVQEIPSFSAKAATTGPANALLLELLKSRTEEMEQQVADSKRAASITEATLRDLSTSVKKLHSVRTDTIELAARIENLESESRGTACLTSLAHQAFNENKVSPDEEGGTQLRLEMLEVEKSVWDAVKASSKRQRARKGHSDCGDATDDDSAQSLASTLSTTHETCGSSFSDRESSTESTATNSPIQPASPVSRTSVPDLIDMIERKKENAAPASTLPTRRVSTTFAEHVASTPSDVQSLTDNAIQLGCYSHHGGLQKDSKVGVQQSYQTCGTKGPSARESIAVVRRQISAPQQPAPFFKTKGSCSVPCTSSTEQFALHNAAVQRQVSAPVTITRVEPQGHQEGITEATAHVVPAQPIRVSSLLKSASSPAATFRASWPTVGIRNFNE